MFKHKIWYLAHPYSNNEQENYEKANQITTNLLDLGINVFSPVTHTHPLQGVEDNSYDFWMSIDKDFMDISHGLILAPNWENSKGCIQEIKTFQNQDKPIVRYEDLIFQESNNMHYCLTRDGRIFEENRIETEFDPMAFEHPSVLLYALVTTQKEAEHFYGICEEADAEPKDLKKFKEKFNI